jgi:putative transcriptional regulator
MLLPMVGINPTFYKGGIFIMDNNIYRVIQRKNMTQANLAQMVGVKREYINRIINRKVTPTVPLGMRIAKALRVPMEDLFII